MALSIHPALNALLEPVATVRPHPRNARAGDTDAIIESIRVNGMYRPLYAQRSTGHILAGNHTYAAAMELGADRVPVIWLDVDDTTAAKILLADNRTADLGSYDLGLLVDLLGALDHDLMGTGYGPDDVTALAHLASLDNQGMTQQAELDAGRNLAPKPRELPLTLIFSSAAQLDAAGALRMGWRNGMISTSLNAARKFLKTWARAPRLQFMDSDWHDYDHGQHLDAVAEIEPVSATVRDICTTQQCEQWGVPFYDLDATLDMAADLAPHVEQVILIPKYHCLDELPREINGAQVTLGYSVETSYGGTPVPITEFAGWPIHLLGGSWDKQRAYLNLMKDDVVSLDNNHILRIAEFGQVSRRDGTTSTLESIMGYPVAAARHAALVLSLAEIANAVVEDYAVDLETITVEDA